MFMAVFQVLHSTTKAAVAELDNHVDERTDTTSKPPVAAAVLQVLLLLSIVKYPLEVGISP